MTQQNSQDRSILVACIGNIFLGDDGFGVEVASRLRARQTPSYPKNVQVIDFGIRGMDLAYTLLDDYEALILVDAVPRGKQAGTISVLEIDPNNFALKSGDGTGAIALDAHSMDPVKVLAFARTLGARPVRTLLVGCEPSLPNIQDKEAEMSMGLSAPVEAAVDQAITLIDELVDGIVKDHSP